MAVWAESIVEMRMMKKTLGFFWAMMCVLTFVTI